MSSELSSPLMYKILYLDFPDRQVQTEDYSVIPLYQPPHVLPYPFLLYVVFTLSVSSQDNPSLTCS